MSSTNRVVLVLALILAVWAVIYYRSVGPVLEELDNPGPLNPPPAETSEREPEVQDPVSSPGEGASDDVPASDSSVELAGNGTPTGEPRVDGGSVPANPEEDSMVDPVIPPPPATTPYVVKAGDTMESIAQQRLGDKRKWVIIAQENPFVDPIKLRVGQELRLPAADATLESVSDEQLRAWTQSVRYTVASGDTLSEIAERFYGSAGRWRLIYDANRDVLPSPDRLRLGMQLVIPQLPAE